MPYINKAKRRECDQTYTPNSPGELNYLITRLITKYLDSKEFHSYQYFNDILGALEGAKLEFYRRVVVPYEDKKIVENGDVYES